MLVIGDVQGCHGGLVRLLKKAQYRPRLDELWFCGDLVNRGGESMEVLSHLNRLLAKGARLQSVLGNHDINLLHYALGNRAQSKPNPEFDQLLAQPEADQWIDWLRQRPLVLRDKSRKLLMIHAGLYPGWSPKQAERLAREAASELVGKSAGKFLNRIYGDDPPAWSEDLRGIDRDRFVMNACTRMRFVHDDGRLNLSDSGPPGSQDKGSRPWYEHPDHRPGKYRVVFGHWSALGLLERKDLMALDTGYVWGRELTAWCPDTDETVQVSAD